MNVSALLELYSSEFLLIFIVIRLDIVKGMAPLVFQYKVMQWPLTLRINDLTQIVE